MAVPPLRALVEAGHEIVCVITRPDRRRGRGGAVTPSPVAQAATELGLPVSTEMADVATAGAELAVVVAYGRIIPVALLEQVPMVNLHFSLLPRWRGAAPVERAILAGDSETGVCVMAVEEGLDTGAVYARRTVPITGQTLAELRVELVDVGAKLLVEALAGGVAGLPEPEPQEGEVTIAQKISSEDLHLRWDAEAAALERVVRLGRAWTTFRGKRLFVVRASVVDPSPDQNDGEVPPGTLVGTSVQTGAGLLCLETVQPESKGPMAAEDWIRGARPSVSDRLGTE
jgi:methionyl-tRNA formyltransferase